MVTEIYYFSGTGNSLYVARTLGALLPNQVSLLPIRHFRECEKVSIRADRIVLVFPVYFQTLPDIVSNFLHKMEFETSQPDIYGVATCNGGPGHVMYSTNRILARKGQSLKAGFCITMPGNSLILRDFTNSEEIRNQRLNESDSRMKEICQYINEKKAGRIEGNDGIKSHFQGIFTGLAARSIYNTPSKFRTTNACVKCGVCVSVCPSKNVTIEKDRVKWGRDCQQCLACFHWCPNGAVEIGNTTAGKIRYHHPEVSFKDITNDGALPADE